MNSTRAIGIVRVSQRDDDSGQSPEVQRRALGQMAELHGWALAPADVLDENDDGIRIRKQSGGDPLLSRARLQWAVEEIEAGHADILAAENFDRLFRGLQVQGEVVRSVEAAGGQVWERSGRISYARAADKFKATIQGASSEYVKETSEERSWDAVEIAIEQGRVPWPNVPPGLIRNDDGTVSRDPKLAPIVRRAFEMRAPKKGTPATVVEVRAYLARNGIERSFHGVTKMLRDRLYVGEIHFGVRHTPNLSAYSPPVVPQELFDRVQAMVVPRGRRASAPRLLSRLARVKDGKREPVLRCATCGGGMVLGSQVQGGRTYAFYRCPNLGKGGGDCKRGVCIGADLAEGVVVDAMRRELERIPEGTADRKAEARDAAEAAADAEDNYQAAVAAISDFRDATSVAKLRELKAEAEALGAHADRLREREGGITIHAVRDWDKLNLDEQREVVLYAVERADVRPGRGQGRVAVRLFGD